MSKMKTKSGAKKRFKFTKTGKIKTHQVGKRHRLIEWLRRQRGSWRRKRVKRLGDNFLSGAVFAGNQHVRVGRPHTRN